jgi:hypothetical protein
VELPQSVCRLGIARADITPPAGIYHRMWGAARHDRAAGVHRPLLATALVFQPASGPPQEAAGGVPQNTSGDPARLQILITLDHCLLGREEMQALIAAVSRQADVPAESILVTFSHTHAAGLMSLDRRELPGGELIPPYLDQINRTLAELVRQALAEMFEATLMYGHGRCNLAAHRDYWDEEAQQYVCGFNPHQTADDTLLVVRATDAQQRTRAVLVNYACHPTTLAWDNQLVSPDYPGAMREVIERELDAPCVFLQGASGDLGPREGFVGDPEVADRNGRQLAHAALSTLTSLPAAGTRYRYTGAVVSGATIGTWQYQPVDAPRREELATWRVERAPVPLAYREDLPREAEVREQNAKWRAEEALAHDAGDTQRAAECRAMVERQTRMLNRLRALPPGASYPFEMISWRMGDAVWIAVQGEPYNELQTALRERFPETPIVVATISNGWGPSYLVPADRYGKGLYQESVAVLAPGCLETLIDAAAARVESLGNEHTS